MPPRRRRWRRAIAGAAIALTVTTGVITGVLVRPGDSGGGHVTVTTFSLDADSDYGSLPPRATWCSGADHCWLFGGSGTISDSGSGSWTLTASGSPRTGVETGLPVYDGATVSFTGEQAAFFDTNASNYYSTATTTPAGSLVSVSMVMHSVCTGVDFTSLVQHVTDANNRYGIMQRNNCKIHINAAESSPPTGGDTDAVLSDGPHCITAVIDARSASAAHVFIDGELDTATINLSPDSSFLGGLTDLRVGGYQLASLPMGGGVSRLRLDFNSALSLADHQALCGSYGLPARRDHTAYADLSWTQTGGARAFAQSATSALVSAGGAPALGWSATAGHGWASEHARINRIATEIDCTGSWTCDGTASTAAAVGPDGSMTAWALTVAAGANDVYHTATGYSATTALHLSMWIKCVDTAVFVVYGGAAGANGDWDIDCNHATLSGGDWTYIDASHAAVTANTAFSSDGSGNGTVRFDGDTSPATASIWMPTLTEVAGLSVIPTGTAAAAVDTGDPVFALANDGTYWQSGDTVTTVLDEIAGTCVVPGNPSFELNDGPCTGILNSVEVTR